MKKINILFIFIFSVPSATFAQQSDLLEKYRSMAVEYNHDLKAADKHISASIELEKAAQKDLRPKLSGDANFQYTGNPIRLTLNLPSMQNPLTFEGKDMKYGEFPHVATTGLHRRSAAGNHPNGKTST